MADNNTFEPTNIPGDVAVQIVSDIGNDVSPKDSRLDYGKDELDFRRGVEERFAAYRKEHPDAMLDIRE